MLRDYAGEPLPNLSGVSVLYVDDNEDARVIMTDLLRACGASAACVENGVEALVYLQTHIPDVLVTDLSMPRMDGLELLQLVRAELPTRHLPAIAVTAYPRDHVDFIGNRFDYFLHKPIDIDVLAKAILTLTQRL